MQGFDFMEANNCPKNPEFPDKSTDLRKRRAIRLPTTISGKREASR